jgi:hypothetical protein
MGQQQDKLANRPSVTTESPRNRVVQLYCQELGSLFITFYDMQEYGGGILTCLHMEIFEDSQSS